MKVLFNYMGISLLAVWTLTGGCIRASLPSPGLPPPSSQNIPQPPPESKRLDEVLLKFQRGIQLLESGRVQESRALFEDLRNNNPNVSVFHNNLGVVYKRLGLLQQASESYQKAIEIHSGYPEPYYNLAIVLREKGEFQKAEEAYKKTISLAPDFRDAHYNLAVLYDLYLNNPVEAVQYYQNYLNLGGENQEEIRIWIAGLQKRMEKPGESP
jgi:tetratricopeptide (TPR) repeat protein